MQSVLRFSLSGIISVQTQTVQRGQERRPVIKAPAASAMPRLSYRNAVPEHDRRTDVFKKFCSYVKGYG
jgi:hypothetical protein